MSWFQGRHDVKVGYEYVNAARISRFWSTSGLRSNFANGTPTSVNTYVVQVTQSDTTYGADIDELFRFRADEHGLLRSGSMDAGSQARSESRLAVRDELELPARDLPARHAVLPGRVLRQGRGAVLQRRVSALQPGLRRDGRRPDGAQVCREPLQPADQHQHDRAVEPCCRRQRPAVVERREPRPHSPDERGGTVTRICVPRRERSLRGRSAPPRVQRVHRRNSAAAAAEHGLVGGLHAQADQTEHQRDRYDSDAGVMGRPHHRARGEQRGDRAGMAPGHQPDRTPARQLRRNWTRTITAATSR